MASEYIGRVMCGRYRLISRLAEGGMGVTYRAWDLRAGGPVVLKMPKRPRDDVDGSEFAGVAARFVREIETMRALSHDYIVPILDHGDDEGLPFVVMRFLPGGSLADHRKKIAAGAGDCQPVAASMLHGWLPSIASALDFIHSQGVLHRDVKPANVFFDGFWNPFLGDFGIAKVVDESAGLEKGQTLTATHLAIGTPDYMAPELLSPKTLADGRADQYALAVCVYELVAGYRPFTGAKAHIVIEHATLPVPPLDRQSLKLPATMTAAVERALSKKPDERFKNCHDFARAVLADVGIQPYEPDVVRLLCPGCRKVLKVPRRAGGGRGNCPSCREFVEIANDFSALWLKSEAALLAETSDVSATPPTFSPPRVLGALDTDPAIAKQSGGMAETVPLEKAGRASGMGMVAAAALLFGLLGVALGLATTHWRWAAHHAAVIQRSVAERERDQATHATALKAADIARSDAVAEVETAWKKKLAEAERLREQELAGTVAVGEPSAQELVGSEEAREDAEELGVPVAVEGSDVFEVKQDEVPQPRPFSALTNSIGIELKFMPAGRLTMGDESTGMIRDVTLPSPFYIGATEVTKEQWIRVMRSRRLSSRDEADERNLPASMISWEEAVQFCERLSAIPEEARVGRVYRLPTEAEWEYACRAGSKTAYSCGDDESRLGDYCWFGNNADKRTHTVGRKKPNAWGLYDMHGNVWEWCSDEWAGQAANGAITDPPGFRRGNIHVYRGGSYDNVAWNCRSAIRVRTKDDWRGLGGQDNLGLRVALSLSEKEDYSLVDLGERRPEGSSAKVDVNTVRIPTPTNSIGIEFEAAR